MRRLGKRLLTLLRSQRGDTLVEVLAALLIAALGAATLSTMVMASVSMSTTSQKALERTYQDEQTMHEVGVRDTVKVKLGAVSKEFSVQLYQSDDGTFVSYENKQGTEPEVTP